MEQGRKAAPACCIMLLLCVLSQAFCVLGKAGPGVAAEAHSWVMLLARSRLFIDVWTVMAAHSVIPQAIACGVPMLIESRNVMPQEQALRLRTIR